MKRDQREETLIADVMLNEKMYETYKEQFNKCDSAGKRSYLKGLMEKYGRNYGYSKKKLKEYLIFKQRFHTVEYPEDYHQVCGRLFKKVKVTPTPLNTETAKGNMLEELQKRAALRRGLCSRVT